MPAPERPLVSVVVLHYDRVHLLGQALDTIRGQDYPNYEVIVVDNRSNASGDVVELVRRYPRVRLIMNETNLGFSGGMNRGLREANGEYVLLTEDDLIIQSNCLSEFVSFIQSQGLGRGLVSGILYNEGDGRIHCAGGEVELGWTLRQHLNAVNVVDARQIRLPFAVTHIAGSFVFSSVAYLRELGGFRPDFFMYWEDTELCIRVKRRGDAIVILPAARAIHVDPPRRPPSRRIECHKLRNWLATFLLHGPWVALPYFIVKYFLFTTPRAAFVNRDVRLYPLSAWAGIKSIAPLLWERFRSADRPTPGGLGHE